MLRCESRKEKLKKKRMPYAVFSVDSSTSKLRETKDATGEKRRFYQSTRVKKAQEILTFASRPASSFFSELSEMHSAN